MPFIKNEKYIYDNLRNYIFEINFNIKIGANLKTNELYVGM